MSSLPNSFTLRANNGTTIQIPSVGFGTFAAGDNSWAKGSVLEALKAGYRHLDCAWLYGVDGQVGEAIRESGIPREDIFVTSKFWPHFGHPDNVELALDKVLHNMGLEYVDLWLAHWPVVWRPESRDALQAAHTGPDAAKYGGGIQYHDDGKPVIDWEHSTASIAKRAGHEGSFVPTWKAMQRLVEKGKARTVGVSNFSVTEMKELLPHEGNVPLSCNQVECHPWLPQREMVAFAREHGIVIACWSPFAGQKSDGATLTKDEKVRELAKKNGMDAGQLLQSWAVQRGTVPLGKSATPERIRSNFEVRELSEEDVQALDALELPDDEGRTTNFSEAWGITLFKN